MPWRQRSDSAAASRNTAEAAIHETIELGGRYGISVSGRIRTASTRRAAILQEILAGKHNLLVMGVTPRSADQLYFGEAPAEILERAPCSVLFVSADPATVSGRLAGARGNTAQA